MKPNLVFVGIEISEIDKNSNMLQIVMKSDSSIFNKYINPLKPISKEMTKINHLTVRKMELYRDNVWKPSKSLREVMVLLLDYLQKFDGPCILIGHKYSYTDSYRLIKAIKTFSMENEFASVIAGFTCTYRMFTEKFPNKNKRELTIHGLAKEIDLASTHPFRDGRSIRHDTDLLEKVTLHYFNADELRANKRSFFTELRKYDNSSQASLSVRQFSNIEGEASKSRAEKKQRYPEVIEPSGKEMSRQTKKDTKKTTKLVVDDFSVAMPTRLRKTLSNDVRMM